MDKLRRTFNEPANELKLVDTDDPWRRLVGGQDASLLESPCSWGYRREILQRYGDPYYAQDVGHVEREGLSVLIPHVFCLTPYERILIAAQLSRRCLDEISETSI